MVDKNRIKECFGIVIAAHEGKEFPEQQVQCESLDDFDFTNKYYKYDYDRLVSKLDSAATFLKKTLPYRVWFRQGDYGLAIQSTGFRSAWAKVAVAPWSEEMPSLDDESKRDDYTLVGPPIRMGV